MARTTIVTALILILGGLLTPRSTASPIVEIRIPGHFYAAPATISLTVAVEPSANNRTLVVEVDSDDYFRSSSVELDGEKEKRFHTMEFKSLPAGEYILRAQVLAQRKVLGTATGTLVVTGGFGNP